MSHNCQSGSNGSVGRAFLWMLVLSILLFWLPVFGPFIAGLVGGSRAGGVGNALLAALLPAILVGLLIALAGIVLGLPILGALFATIGAAWSPPTRRVCSPER